jgi:nucleotide-binding universal stress UspA family protein
MNPPLVLVGTNLSHSGLAALQAGARWARETDATLAVCYVAPPRPPVGAAAQPQQLDQALHLADVCARVPALVAAELDRLGASPGLTRVIVREGWPCGALLAAAEELDASLLVLGTRASPAFSPVVADVLRSARVPVLLARSCAPHGCVVACTDLSREDAPVVRAAIDVACRRGASLLAVHVVPPLGPQDLRERLFIEQREKLAADQLSFALGRLQVPCRVEMQHGPVVQSLLSTAEAQADLVVMGRPSSHGAAHHGTIARAVATAVHAPVLMVPVE